MHGTHTLRKQVAFVFLKFERKLQVFRLCHRRIPHSATLLYLAIVGQRPVCLGCASFCNFRWSRLFVFGEQKVIWMPFSSALPMATTTKTATTTTMAADNGSTRTARSRYRTRFTRCPCRTRREMHATSGDVLHSLNSVWAYVASRA